MRYLLIVFWLLFWSVTSTLAQVSIGISIWLSGVSIGINLPFYPTLVQVPGYPVYYAPQLNLNFFFYDGLYWLYQSDNWYVSSWYNGPWGLVAPEFVPLFVLRIPVRYYRAPPVYFHRWRPDAPPRWGEHWGNEWLQKRRGWDSWSRSSMPAPAPLPHYQQQYSGDRYPPVEQQQQLHNRNYRYQPRDAVVQQPYQEQAAPRAPAPSQREQPEAPRERMPQQQDIQRSSPPPPLPQGGPAVPRAQPPQRGGEEIQRSAPSQVLPQPKGPAIEDQRQQPQQGAAQREPQTPRSSQENVPNGKEATREPKRKDRKEDEERGQERNR